MCIGIFTDISAPLIFYGHHYQTSDIVGKSRYVNLGSAGCFDKPVVRLAWLEEQEGQLKIVKEAIDYEDGDMIAQFEKRQVPALDFIKKVFIKRN